MTLPGGAAAVASLRDHWRWRPEWTAGRVCLWWYLTIDAHPVLDALHRRLSAELHRLEAVDAVPRRWLHLTVQEVGYADRLPPRRLGRLVPSARRALTDLPPFGLELGQPTGLPGAVVLPAAPTGPVDALRRRLRAATRSAVGPSSPDLHPVPPHVSLAYVNRDVGAAEVLAPLAVAGAASLTVPVSAVTLAAVTRRDRHYEWTDQGTLRLGAA